MAAPAFHLAFPVADLEATRHFYVERLGCTIGRSTDRWIDFNFGGHQITAHLKPEEAPSAEASGATNAVDGHNVPVRHFGLILGWAEWHKLAERMKAADIDFIIEPYIRFAGAIGEQATMFFLDPSGNALEFKSFKDMSQLFAA